MHGFHYRIIAKDDLNEGWAWDSEPEQVYEVTRDSPFVGLPVAAWPPQAIGIIMRDYPGHWTAVSYGGALKTFWTRHDASLWLAGEPLY